MSLTPRNTRELVDPAKLKLKILLVALPGTGKTKWLATVPSIGLAACETGHGKGLMTIAQSGLQFVEPENYKELEAFCSGDVFKDSEALGLDSLTAMTKTFIRDYALSFPRKQGQSQKRASGVPEQDDYGVMGELTRRLLSKIINLDKHIIVTTTLKPPYDANPDENREATPGMPDLPGQLAMASAAMFDTVLIMRTRSVLADPKNAKSRFTQRYFITQQSDKWLAKTRLNANGAPILAEEEPFDSEKGTGLTFPNLLTRIQQAYQPSEVKA